MSELKADVAEGKYVIAVSGGVDSAVLLDLLGKEPSLKLVVAHFDHGIRADSADDRQLVQDLAEQYGLPFEYAQGKLGPEASEETARNARYDFLRSIKDKHEAKAIITAHHEDDLIETAIINLIRGTRRKGLSSLKTSPLILRPMLGFSRQDIEKYARDKRLVWREDPTNQDQSYLRNYVRLTIIPALMEQDPKWRRRLLNKIRKNEQIDGQINSAIEQLAEQNIAINKKRIEIPRHWLIMLPNSVGLEIMKYSINLLEAGVEINRSTLKSLLLFAKTAVSGKKRPIGKSARIAVEGKSVVLSAEDKD